MSSIYNKHLGTLLAYADAVFSNTNIEKRKIIELGINPEKIYVIPPGIDVSKWESRCGDRFRKKYGLKDKFIILFAGAKSYHKGALHLLKAMQLIQQHEKNVVLVAIGYDTAEWHEEKIKLRNLNVIDLGYVSEKEKHDAFDACDLFAMPSKADSFGIVYLEAWICGKPVIGARVGAIQEVIREGVDGYMVKFGDVSDLAKKILHLSKNPDLCERLGANGKKRVLKNHNWEKIGQKISSVYESIVGRN